MRARPWAPRHCRVRHRLSSEPTPPPNHRPGGGHGDYNSRQHPDHRWRRHPPGPAHRRRREPRRNGAWYRIVLHHPSRLPGDASLVPLSWRAASCRSGIHRYLRSRHHPAPGTLGYPRARGDRAGPSQPKSQGQGRCPGCDLRGRGGAHKTPGPGGQRPFRQRGSPAGAANNAKDGNQVPPRGPATTLQHHRCRTGGSA